MNQTIPSLGSAFLFPTPEFASLACAYDTYKLRLPKLDISKKRG